MAVRLLVGRCGVDARRARTGRAGRWHGGSGSGAWTDGPKTDLDVRTQRTVARRRRRRRGRARSAAPECQPNLV
jgi:hypothetical protein